jgi:heme-degrading monooxygenase HmoA
LSEEIILMAVLWIARWNIPLGRMSEYNEWAANVIPRLVSAPKVKEFRAYRSTITSHRIMVMLEFESLKDWAAFTDSDEGKTIWTEIMSNTTNLSAELWGPSPFAPEPIHPE